MSNQQGYYNFLDVQALRKIAPRAHNKQLEQFLALAMRYHLTEQRIIILDEINNRTVGVYQKQIRH